MTYPYPKQSNIVGSDIFVRFKYDDGSNWSTKKLLLNVLRYDIEAPYLMIGISTNDDKYNGYIFIIDTDSTELPILEQGNITSVSIEGYYIENATKTYNIDYDFPDKVDMNISYYVYKYPINDKVKTDYIYIVADEKSGTLRFYTKQDILNNPENLMIVITTWRKQKYSRENIAFILEQELLQKYIPAGMIKKEYISDYGEVNIKHGYL